MYRDGTLLMRPSRNLVATDCIIERYEAAQAGLAPADIPQCQADGRYVRP